MDHIENQWQKNQWILLCSDGLNKELSDDEIYQYLAHNNIAEANRALLHSTLVAGARDNVTCILVKVDNNTENVNEKDKTIPVFIKN